MINGVKNFLKWLFPYSWKKIYNKNTSVRYFFQAHIFGKQTPNTDSENKILDINNPEFQRISKLFSEINSDKSFWLDWFDNSDFKNFKAENVFVTQLAGLRSIKTAYENTVEFAVKNDRLKLMDVFDEDSKFGVESVLLGKEAFSRDRVDSVIEINFFSKLIGLTRDSEIKFLDIGAGYGRLSSRVLQAFPGAYVYCGDVVPQATFLCDFYMKFKGFNSSQFTCGSYDGIKSEKHFDLVVNIHSFSEAPLVSIRKWLDLIYLKAEYIFIVPSGDELVSMEHDGSRLSYEGYLNQLGYELVEKAYKYKGEDFPRDLCLSPTNYYLFRKSCHERSAL
jgi:hypothetical protein